MAEKVKCKGIDRDRNVCRRYELNNSGFCRFHQYMVEYDVDMMKNLSLCSGCKKMYYLPNGGTCIKCKTRVKKKKPVVKCKKDGCKNKRSVKNIYCGNILML